MNQKMQYPFPQQKNIKFLKTLSVDKVAEVNIRKMPNFMNSGPLLVYHNCKFTPDSEKEISKIDSVKEILEKYTDEILQTVYEM